MILGLSGFAGVGKDTIADILTRNHGFVKIALADQIKRMIRDTFGFSDDQLWGSSRQRNQPDHRYPRSHSWPSMEDREDAPCLCCGIDLRGTIEAEDTTKCFLTPRYALQTLGTEYGRNCYGDVWVEYAVRVAKRLEARVAFGDKLHDPQGYDPTIGLYSLSGGGQQQPCNGVVIPDVRFKNEVSGLRRAGANLVRIRRPGYESPVYDHPSETEQTKIPDSDFDYIYRGGETLEDIELKVAEMLGHLSNLP